MNSSESSSTKEKRGGQRRQAGGRAIQGLVGGVGTVSGTALYQDSLMVDLDVLLALAGWLKSLEWSNFQLVVWEEIHCTVFIVWSLPRSTVQS